MLFMINWSIDGSNVREVNDRFSSGKEKFFGIELVGGMVRARKYWCGHRRDR